MSVIARLDDFRGESRFETWACKFAIFEASAVLRRRLWKEHEQPPADDGELALAVGAGDADEPSGSERRGARSTRCSHDARRKLRACLAAAVDGAAVP